MSECPLSPGILPGRTFPTRRRGKRLTAGRPPRRMALDGNYPSGMRSAGMAHKRSILWFAAVLLVLAAGRPSFGQTLPPGPQVLTFFSDVDDSDQPYAICLPRNFKADKKYPLVVSLHGAASNHRLNLRRVFGQSNRPGETDVEATRYFPEWR